MRGEERAVRIGRGEEREGGEGRGEGRREEGRGEGRREERGEAIESDSSSPSAPHRSSSWLCGTSGVLRTFNTHRQNACTELVRPIKRLICIQSTKLPWSRPFSPGSGLLTAAAPPAAAL